MIGKKSKQNILVDHCEGNRNTELTLVHASSLAPFQGAMQAIVTLVNHSLKSSSSVKWLRLKDTRYIARLEETWNESK